MSEATIMLELLGYGFIQRAYIGGILIALCASLLGLFLVLRRLSLIGDGLAHASFGGIALGLLLDLNPIAVALGVASLASLGIHRLMERARTHGDAAIAVIFSFGMAVAITIIGWTRGFDTNLFSYLFGSILSITETELWLIGAITLLTGGFVLRFYHDLIHISFNEDLARVDGVRATRINQALVVLTALTVVAAIKAVGILLVTAMIVIPPLTALQLCTSFRSSLFTGAIAGVSSTIIGITLAYQLNLPPSGVIVLTMVGLFLISLGIDSRS
ncbi:MAG: metal ABC transporter permease [Candidatus Nanohaloarchaeota archaeon QJJ-5]|nr:metal ABC transporter permease [Candidatus Nanohaloarchaeota archaeon QJJ-5]